MNALRRKDAGRGFAALDRESQRGVGVGDGDYVSLTGAGDVEVVLQARPGYPEDEGNGVVRMDERARRELDVGVGDTVTVERAEVEPAEQVTLGLPEDLPVNGTPEPILRDRLVGRAVSAGHDLEVSLGYLDGSTDSTTEIRVVDTEPDGPTVVGDGTDVQISEYPLRHWTEPDDGPEPTFGFRFPRLALRLHRLPDQFVPDWFRKKNVGIAVGLVMLVVGTSYAMAFHTTSPVRPWLQAVGTVVVVVLSGLTLWYQSQGRTGW